MHSNHNSHPTQHETKGNISNLPSLEPDKGIAGRTSIDKVVARIQVPHTERFGSVKEIRPGVWVPFDYYWVDVPNGKIGIRSFNPEELFISFNPSLLLCGHNLNCYDYAVQQALLDAVLAIGAARPQVFESAETLQFAYESAELSALHLCCDWIFPSRRHVLQVISKLKNEWGWLYNRVRNEHYPTTLYLNHKTWDLMAYVKEDEVQAKHPKWSPRVHQLAKNRLRVEIKLKRGDLVTMGPRRIKYGAKQGKRLLRYRFGRSAIWHAEMSDQIYDLYISRLRPIGNTSAQPRVLPLHHLLAQYGARPAWPRTLTYPKPTPFEDGVLGKRNWLPGLGD